MQLSTWAPQYYTPTPIELASGMVTAMCDLPDLVAASEAELGPEDGPRKVLEELVLGGLQQPPLVVAFSGGRDSSALLAVGTHVARREGLEPPVAFTFRYGSAEEAEAEADEAGWQELVVRHLGVENWEVVQIGDRHDVVGDIAREFIIRHGLVLPSTMYNNALGLIRATGGTHMSGEGGDEIFGVRRSTILRRLRDHPAYLTKRRHIGYAVLTLGPRATRVAAWRRSLHGQLFGALSHLRPEPRQQLIGDLAWHLTAQPLEFTKSLGWHLRRRAIVAYQEGAVAFSREHDVQHFDPFLEPRFVAAFARSVRPLGMATRSAAMRALFSDLLPDEILTRTSKALFNRGFLTETGRGFARQWQGGGVDTELVDPEALKTAWLAKWPQPHTFGLLQAAWLHENRAAPPNHHAGPAGQGDVIDGHDETATRA